VTGAGRRVGAAIARDLARRGWRLTLHYNSSMAEAEAIAQTIRRNGGQARAVGADLREDDAPDRLLAEAEKDAPVTLLVNNAAIFAEDDPQSATASSLREHFDVNAGAPILLAKALHATRLRDDGRAVVVNILDNKLYAPNADFFSYTVSKFALAGATKALAIALAPHVRVCGVAPSLLLVSGSQTEEAYQAARRINPLREPIPLDDVCRTVAFLAETTSINGEIVSVDGGQTLMNLPRDVAFLDAAIVKRFQ
jgi:NAD(P)-dependent dehydrogenase (short-subunit alcohol dehydrogenase family)